MWLFTEKGFYSVVIDAQHDGRMLIRARCRQDAFNLYNAHHETLASMTEPTSDATRDYRWRLSVSKADWIELAALLASEIDYGNFKSACHKRPDQDSKAGALMKVWQILADVQREENYPTSDKFNDYAPWKSLTTIDEPDKLSMDEPIKKRPKRKTAKKAKKLW